MLAVLLILLLRKVLVRKRVWLTVRVACTVRARVRGVRCTLCLLRYQQIVVCELFLVGVVIIMLLTVDVGNTHTVIGGYAEESLEFVWRISSDKNQTEDEIRATLSSMFFAQQLDCSCITGLALASVVPQLSVVWKRVARDLFHTEAFVCTAQTTHGLFVADYPNVNEIGADRIADALAAVHVYGAPVVVVDFGTATNIEVINKEGQFIGGILAPGVLTSASALFAYAAKLSATELADPGVAIGKSTEGAIRSGIVYGEAARVDGLVHRIIDELGYEAPVVATGGLAHIISSCSETITTSNANLTLEGLRLAYNAACTERP